MTDNYTVRHDDQRAARDADQTEKVAMLLGSTVLDAGVRDDLIADAIEDEFEPNVAGLDDDRPGRERWHRQDLGVEGGVGATQEEIHRRSVLLGDAYPFRLERGNLIFRPSVSGFYEYCLGISVAPNITRGAYTGLPRTFERVVALITRLHMGAHTEHFHTGFPRDGAFGTWYSAMMELRRLSGEWWWNPEEGYPAEPTVGGDGGIDFVVWKRAMDARPGALFVVGQCACGGDWDQKLNEIDLRVLSAWFRPVSWVDPIRAFATPFCLSDGNFQAAHKRAGWVLDRVRLSAMAAAVALDPQYVDWKPRLRELVALAVDQAA